MSWLRYRSQKLRYRVRYSEAIRRSLTTYIEAFSSISGTISKPQNSYTYIEEKNWDIVHDIEYIKFIYVHRHPPISGVFPWADGIPYIRCYVQHTVVPAGKWLCPQKNSSDPKIQLEVDLCDLSLCMNLHVFSSCSDPLSLSLAKAVCESMSGGRSPGSGQLPWPFIDGLWTQKILSMLSPNHGQMQAHKKHLIIDIFLQLTP